MIEKPFGEDAASAKELNRQLREGFDESQIFRIDHYLGKEMVQNIHIIRFANLFLEPLWNRQYIECIQITASESIGVGERAGFYDRTGALRDMVQNHLLQMLMLVAMEPPSSLHPEAIHQEKLKVLTSLRRYREDEVAQHVVRGQYREGRIGEEDVVAYRQEKGIPHDSQTETYVAVTAWVDNLRWQGVPFYLRTGKRLAEKATEIVIQFKSIPGNFYFPNQTPTPNRLVISIQPTEAIYLVVNSKQPGQIDQLFPAVMEFCHSCDVETPEAYEALLHDAWMGDKTFFTHGDEVELAWRWIDPIRSAFEKNFVPLEFYESGSWGPKEADALLAKRGHYWWTVARRDFS
jgi:glucose-6-phosphate 1-dehydrogenase